MTLIDFPSKPELLKRLDEIGWPIHASPDLGKPYGDINGQVGTSIANPPEEEVNDLARYKDALLDEREITHGPYAIKCEIIMAIMREIEGYRGGLDDVQNVSLDMIIHKMGRILAGDPNHKDHWADIAGYATLVSKSL
jgi:hypothetical protein